MQNREYKKNMLCKVGISDSLCSRTVSLTIFKAIFAYAIELSSHFFVVNYGTVINDTEEQRVRKGKISSRSVAHRDSYN